jgi:spermidine synthase
MTPLADRLRRPYLTFGILQIAIGLGGAFSFLVIFRRFVDPSFLFVDASGAIVGGFGWVVALLFAHTAVAILWPTFAMGLLFPVAVRCALGSVREVAGDTGRLYALNTVGAILGATLATFFIVPLLGVGWTMLLLAFGSLALGAFVILRTGEAEMPQRAMLSALPIVLLAVVVVRLGFTQLPIVIQTMQPLERMVYYADGPLATISVVANAKDERTIYVDNVGVAGTDPMLLTDQKSLAHVPMLFVKDPKRVLTVGFGSGGASYSYTRYPMLEEIHCVEIDPTVPRAASTLVASNWGIIAPKYRLPDDSERILVPPYVHERNGTTDADYTKEIPVIWDHLTAEVDFRPSLMEPTAAAAEFSPIHRDQSAPFGSELLGYHTFDERYELILDDARELLQSSDVQYDIIATDCTDLRYKTNANLYDLQYFTACSERLAPGGLVVVWMPLGGLTTEMFDVALRTFQAVFPEMAVWYMNNEPTHYCLLLGWNDALEIDLDVMAERLAIPGVARDLRELNLDSIEKVLSCYVTDSRFLADSLGEGMLNTENMPIIEFESPKFGYNDQPVIDNIFRLAEGRNDVMAYVVGDNDLVEATRERLAAYEAAEMDILRGHEKYRLLQLDEANRLYMAARAAAPDDRAIDALLDFREVKLIADVSGVPWHTLQVGRLYAQQGRDSEALEYLRRVWELNSASANDPETAARVVGMRLDAMREGIAIYDRNDRREQARRLRSQMRMLGAEPPIAPSEAPATTTDRNAGEEAATP